MQEASPLGASSAQSCGTHWQRHSRLWDQRSMIRWRCLIVGYRLAVSNQEAATRRHSDMCSVRHMHLSIAEGGREGGREGGEGGRKGREGGEG